ncbi:MAG: hypothetical protein Q9202_003961 [Teloschistes flavicans]
MMHPLLFGLTSCLLNLLHGSALPTTSPADPRAVAIIPPTSPSTLRDAESTRCNVPGTNTVLNISSGYQRLYPFRMQQVLLQARKTIRQKLADGGGDRPLLKAEIPFQVIEWRLEIEAVPVLPPEGEMIPLTWELLLEAMEGLFLCMYDAGQFVELRASIARKEGADAMVYKGDVFLTIFGGHKGGSWLEG